MTVDTLQYDNGIVHQKSHCQCQPCHRDDVQRQSGLIHHGKCHDHRNRNGYSHDDRAADVPQEKEEHQKSQKDGLNRGVAQIGHRSIDEQRLVVDRLQLDSLWQFIHNRRHPALHLPNDAHRIGIRLFLNDQHDSWFVVRPDTRPLFYKTIHYISHILDANDCSAHHSHARVLDLLHAAVFALGLNREFLTLIVDETRGKLQIVHPQGCLDLLNRDAMGFQADRIDQNLNFASQSADRVCSSHSRNPLDAGLQVPLRNPSEFSKSMDPGTQS